MQPLQPSPGGERLARSVPAVPCQPVQLLRPHHPGHHHRAGAPRVEPERFPARLDRNRLHPRLCHRRPAARAHGRHRLAQEDHGLGLAVWSGLTAVNALAWNFWSFLLIRMGVGIGEASYAPAANSLIGDLFPANKRARAMGIFMLGLPLGLVLAFFTIGAMVQAFGSWRAPFVIAAIPGLILALFMFFIKEPARGRGVGQGRPLARGQAAAAGPGDPHLLVADPGGPHLQLRHLRLQLLHGADAATLLPAAAAERGRGHRGDLRVTGLIGLTVGGWLADKAHEKSSAAACCWPPAACWSPPSPPVSRCSPGASRSVCSSACSASAGCSPTPSIPASTPPFRTL